MSEEERVWRRVWMVLATEAMEGYSRCRRFGLL